MLGLKGIKWLVPTLVAVALVAFALAAPAALASSIGVTPNPASLGSTFWVTADGFQPYEVVSTWLGLPNGTTVGTGQTIADESGTVEFHVTPPYWWPQGMYRAVARAKSGLLLYVDFWVNGPVVPTATATPTAVPLQYLGDQPGRTFTYSGSGYKASELIWVWYQNPAGTVISFGKVYADAWGNISFPITLGADWPYGAYHFASQGQTSKHQTDMQMAYFDGKITGLLGREPVTPQQGSSYDFNATGFKPGEKVNMWVGLPGNGVKALPQKVADSGGEVAFTFEVTPGMPSGTYRVVAYGASSHHQVYADYDYFPPSD